MKRFCLYIVACCMILSSCTEDSMPGNMAFGTPTSSSGSGSGSGSGTGTEETYTISSSVSSLSFTADGGSQSITITSNFTWSVISSPSWITISPASGTSGSTSITITASKNSNTSARTGTITLGNSSNTVSVYVSQEAASSTVSGNTYTVSGVSFKMIAVEGGTFTMGATSEQGSDAFDDEKPTHSVTLSSFSIGETEVTQALWQAVMGQTPTSDGSQWSSTYGLGSNYPAYYVSWNDCQTFITKLNDLTGKTFRLPTEAEWEYAARGGKKSQGYKYSGSNTIGDVAWYTDNSGSTTHNVGTKAANELGLYDMSGNVWEWCQDWYGSYSSSSQTNPTGPSTGSLRVDRGGSWNYGAGLCRVSLRLNNSPDRRYCNLGLRLAL